MLLGHSMCLVFTLYLQEAGIRWYEILHKSLIDLAFLLFFEVTLIVNLGEVIPGEVWVKECFCWSRLWLLVPNCCLVVLCFDLRLG